MYNDSTFPGRQIVRTYTRVVVNLVIIIIGRTSFANTPPPPTKRTKTGRRSAQNSYLFKRRIIGLTNNYSKINFYTIHEFGFKYSSIV